jgi:hypothetical protein
VYSLSSLSPISYSATPGVEGEPTQPAVLERDYGLFRFKLLFLDLLFVTQDSIQDALSFVVVEFIFPPGNDNSCDAVANEICDSAHLGHESIHPQQQRNACDGNRA